MGSLIKNEFKLFGDKFAETVCKFFEINRRPKLIRQIAEAEKDAAIIKAKGEIEVDRLKRDYDQELLLRAQTQEIRRQRNIDEVCNMAKESMPENTKVSDQQVDEDWFAKFINIVGDISDEKMKVLWAKILAGEIKSPESYSKRTLDILVNLSKSEAELFVKVSQFILRSEGDYYIFKRPWDEFGISVNDIIELVEAGILQSNIDLQMVINNNEDRPSINIIENGKQSYKLVIPPLGQVTFPILSLTTAGKQLSRLIDIIPNDKYIKEYSDHLIHQGAQFSPIIVEVIN